MRRFVRDESYDGFRWLLTELEAAVTTDGNVLAFLAVSALAVGAAVVGDWRYQEDVSMLPSVIGRDGRRYHYRRMAGGKQVTIYLPTGRLVIHHTTIAAARDEAQLADEVSTLVNDLYIEG